MITLVVVTRKVFVSDAHVLRTGKLVLAVFRAVWVHVPTARRLTFVLQVLFLL